jgi:hypothetical protein
MIGFMIQFQTFIQDRAIKDRDDSAVLLLNETIRLWNSMWIADQIYKSKVSDNVRTMQHRCANQLVLLQSSIESIMAEDASRPRKLSAAPEDRVPRSAPPSALFIW